MKQYKATKKYKKHAGAGRLNPAESERIMNYTIFFSLQKGKRRNQKLVIRSREECLLVIENMGTHAPYASFCLVTDDGVTHKVENIIYENRKLKSHRGL
jgi:hypothetical protein